MGRGYRSKNLVSSANSYLKKTKLEEFLLKYSDKKFIKSEMQHRSLHGEDRHYADGWTLTKMNYNKSISWILSDPVKESKGISYKDEFLNVDFANAVLELPYTYQATLPSKQYGLINVLDDGAGVTFQGNDFVFNVPLNIAETMARDIILVETYGVDWDKGIDKINYPASKQETTLKTGVSFKEMMFKPK